MPSKDNMPKGEILLYQTEDGSTRIDVRLQDNSMETLPFTKRLQMSQNEELLLSFKFQWRVQ